MKKSKLKGYIFTVCAVFFWLCIWQIVSVAIGKELLLPSPVSVFSRVAELALKLDDFWLIILNSVKNILLGLALGFVLGTICAVITSHVKAFEILLKPLISIVKITPVASFILLLILWMNRTDVPSFVSVLIVFPIVWANISQGITSTDQGLKEVGKIYKLSPIKKLIYLYVPSVLPSALASLMSSIGLAWKAGISAEILALPHETIGYEIFQSKTYLNALDVFAWTVIVVLLSVIIEKLIIFLIGALTKKILSRRGSDA